MALTVKASSCERQIHTPAMLVFLFSPNTITLAKACFLILSSRWNIPGHKNTQQWASTTHTQQWISTIHMQQWASTIHTHQWTSTRHSNVSIRTAKGIHHRHSSEHSSHYSNEHPSQATTGNVTLTCYFHIWQSNLKLKSEHITSPFDPDQTLSTLSLLTSCCFHSKLHAGVTLATVVSSWHDKLHHWNRQCWSAVARVVAITALKVVYMTVYKGVVKQPAHLTLGGPKGFSQKIISGCPYEMRTFCKSQLHTISRLFSLRESLRSHAAMKAAYKAAVHCCTHQYGEWRIFFITRIRSHTHHLCTADRSDAQITPPSRWFVAADTQALQPKTITIPLPIPEHFSQSERHNYHSKQKT